VRDVIPPPDETPGAEVVVARKALEVGRVVFAAIVARSKGILVKAVTICMGDFQNYISLNHCVFTSV
jgi:hypothetical protein